jgi:type IV secretory pathway ATPase VirB11/archaellum biosynthesis ATPase
LRIGTASSSKFDSHSRITNERLQAAIERVARILGQDLTTQNPILNTRLPDGSRVAVVGSAFIDQRPDLYRAQIQPLVYLG